MRYLLLFLCCSLLPLAAQSQNKPAYQLFNAKGKKVKYGKMLKSMTKQDIILFGEYHNNAITHWLQLELTRDLGLAGPGSGS